MIDKRHYFFCTGTFYHAMWSAHLKENVAFISSDHTVKIPMSSVERLFTWTEEPKFYIEQFRGGIGAIALVRKNSKDTHTVAGVWEYEKFSRVGSILGIDYSAQSRGLDSSDGVPSLETELNTFFEFVYTVKSFGDIEHRYTLLLDFQRIYNPIQVMILTVDTRGDVELSKSKTVNMFFDSVNDFPDYASFKRIFESVVKDKHENLGFFSQRRGDIPDTREVLAALCRFVKIDYWRFFDTEGSK